MNIAVGHQYWGYIHMLKALFISHRCIRIRYNDLILYPAIYLMIKHQKMHYITPVCLLTLDLYQIDTEVTDPRKIPMKLLSYISTSYDYLHDVSSH